jgi:hypothetical protein
VQEHVTQGGPPPVSFNIAAKRSGGPTRVFTSSGTADRDAPLRLAIAAELAFPDGSMKAKGLRKEAERGRLAIFRIANKDYTTLRAIDEMTEACRVSPKVPVSGSAERAETAGRSSRGVPGSSSTELGRSARDALRKKLGVLKAA